LLLTDIIIASDALNDQLTFSITMKIQDKPLILKTQQTNVRYVEQVNEIPRKTSWKKKETNMSMLLSRTLWVKAINNAVEECQAAERYILADKAMFAVTGKKITDDTRIDVK
jgi:hypothetical protein